MQATHAIGMYRTVLDGRIHTANAALAQLLGFDSERQVLEKSFEDLGITTRPSREELRNRLLQEGDLGTIESAWIRSDGSCVFVQEFSRSLRDEGGRVIGFEGTLEPVADDVRLSPAALGVGVVASSEHATLLASFESARDAMLVTDADGYICRANQGAERMFNHSRIDLIGRRIDLLVPEHMRTRLLSAILGTMPWAYGEAASDAGELQCARKDGSVFPAQVAATPAVSGGERRIVCSLRDLSGQQRLEQATAAAARFSASILEAIAEPAAVFDASGTPVMLNPAWRQLAQECSDIPLAASERDNQLQLCDVPQSDRGLRIRQFAQGLKSTMAGTLPACEMEFQAEGRGQSRSFRARITRVEAATGKMALVMLTDVSAQRAAEEHLREAHEQYRQLFDAVPVPLHVWDMDSGRVVASNPAMQRTYGYSADELAGMLVIDLHPPKDLTELQEFWERDENSAASTSRCRHVRKDGSVFDVETTSHGVRINGKSARVVMSSSIAERRRSDQLRDADRDLLDRISRGAALELTLQQLCTTLEAQLDGDVRTAVLLAEGADEALRLGAAPNIPRELGSQLGAALALGRDGSDAARVFARNTIPSADRDFVLGWNDAGLLARRLGLHAVWSVVVRDANGEGVGCLLFFTPVARPLGGGELKAAARAAQLASIAIGRYRDTWLLRDCEEKFSQVFEVLQETLWIHDFERNGIVFVSPGFESLTGYPAYFLHNSPEPWKTIVHPADHERLRYLEENARAGDLDEEWRIVRADGALRRIRVRTRLIRDAKQQPVRMAAVAEDITHQKEVEERVQYLEQYDSLTGLPNRLLFRDRLRQALAQAKRYNQIVGVLFINLDGFKKVNDTLGLLAGDEILRQVSARLSESVRSCDTVGRFGVDEFGIVLLDLKTADDAGVVAAQVLESLSRPFAALGHEIFLTASVGIARSPADGDDTDELIRCADSVMYRAKEMGGANYQFYDGAQGQMARRRITLETGLRNALLRGEFRLHYQPKVALKDGVLTGCEALLRWERPGVGMVSPGEFIPMLEETGLIIPVGEWVLRTVCDQMQVWKSEGLPPVRVAVNLSVRQLRDKGLRDIFARVVSEYGIDHDLIELEITESSLMRNAEEAANILGGLKNHGFRLAVDDFGTGYSSLSYLKRFPLDTVKIDRAFVKDLPEDSESAAIALAIVNLGHALDLTVVAEGVETREQWQMLNAQGCDQVQGYVLSRPLSTEQFCSFLHERNQRRSVLPG